ncbi:MAG: Hydrolase, metalloendopeptidase [Candidatus Electronema aureum]|uniref:Hydrolase, metalloendopeptidase n=1 Tax=Candidatus Electronema aureum TaxID=2005002 RepID=A0A521G4Y3_9BACT|nr:MAG: Hydrolase, metalloendopeptidase [Candidatus Electronema aureum]
MTDFSIGSIHHGFILKRKEQVAEISSEVFLFEHQVLGTPALAIKNSDPNKTFCFAFQTVPNDNTGVAHILEHSVLVGSKKYPVQDIFGEIHKGGLMTFLNAMTGADTTWYPFATRNLSEYFSIMDVYCDVVLNPILARSTFEQEGWHYHKESQGAPLEFQGVVLNEMKGAFGDPTRALFQNTFAGLMPESTYAQESGGDPACIPALSYEQFIEFHRKHYHPSNGMLFFYGDADLEQELAAVQDKFLCTYTSAGEKAKIVPGRTIAKPVFIDDTYAVQPGSNLKGKTYLAVGTAIGTLLDRELTTAFQIIANILYNSDASPLKKAIVEAGLGKDFGGMFITDHCFQTVMLTYLVGSDADKRDRFLELHRQALTQIAEQGLEHDLVLSELNHYEFSVREELTHAQRGLDLIGKALTALQHGADPFAALEIDQLFAAVRRKALEEQYFEQLIQSTLLDSPTFAAVTLRPDPDKATRTQQEEQRRLAAYEQTLDPAQVQSLIATTQELMRLQQTPNTEEQLALVPRLARKDLECRPPMHSASTEVCGSVECISSELDTNGITYVQFGLDCAAIGPDLLPYLDLFATIATEIGTSKRDYVRFAKDINICTGGFSHSFSTYHHLESKAQLLPLLWFQIKALSGYLPQALDLVREVFADVNLSNRQRIKEIVLREFTWAEHSVQSEGYQLAASRVFAHLSRAGMINEHVNGATAYLTLKELAANYDKQEEQFLAKIERLRQLVLQPADMKIAVTGSAADIGTIKAQINEIKQSLLGSTPQPAEMLFPQFAEQQAFTTSADVVYNVQGCNLFTNPKQYDGTFEVLKTWLSRDYLWNTVRQLGGAYGCFVQFHPVSGNFALISFRDPQVSKTYAAYEAIAAAVKELDLSHAKLDQLIIGAYGSLNPLRSPAAEGVKARDAYLCGITPEHRQQILEQLIDTEAAALRGFAPLFAQLTTNSFKATIGSSEKIRANAELFNAVVEL